MKLKSLDRKKGRDEKLNLIPIMDAVFIFIFFLLMSAQFVEIYEIGSDAPAVTTTDSIKDKRPPLNLTMVIENETVHLKTGINERTIASFPMVENKYDVLGIRQKIIEIKRSNVEEKSIIFRPMGEVSYERLVELMDAVRKIDKNLEPVIAENKEGQVIKTWELFNNIIFETLI
jgi:biopolymer transport protein ExbD